MTYRGLTDLILTRARRLGLKNPETGFVDATDVEMALYSQILDLVGRYDLDGYTVINRTMFVTTIDTEVYALPDDFGRFVTIRDQEEYGLALDNGTDAQPSALVYREPEDYERLRNRLSTNRPRYFTIAASGQLRLDPIPDAQYTGVGVYIRDIQPSELDEGSVPLQYANMLQHATLGELSSDFGHASAPVLLAEKQQALTTLVNGQARQRMHFQRKHTQIGRTSRYYRT